MAQVIQDYKLSDERLTALFMQYQTACLNNGTDGLDSVGLFQSIQLHFFTFLEGIAEREGVSPDSAPDILQEFLLHRMFRNAILKWKPGGSSARNWICSLFKKTIADHLREISKERRKYAPLEIVMEGDDGEEAEIENPKIDALNPSRRALHYDPETRVCSRALALILREIIKETIDEVKNERHRLFLSLHLVIGCNNLMTGQEMARILDVNPNTMAAAINRLVKDFHPRLKQRVIEAGFSSSADLMEMISRVRDEAFDFVEPDVPTRQVAYAFLDNLRRRDRASSEKQINLRIVPIDLDIDDIFEVICEKLKITAEEAREHLLSAVCQVVSIRIERGEGFDLFTALEGLDEATTFNLFTGNSAPPAALRACRELSALARGEILYGLRERLERWSEKKADPLGALMELCGMDGVTLTGFLASDAAVALSPECWKAIADALSLEVDAVEELDRYDSAWRQSQEEGASGTRGARTPGRAMVELALKIIGGE